MSDLPPASPSPAPGWYGDTTNPSIQRYWDGSSWTDHTAPQGVTPPPNGVKQGMSGKSKGWIIGGSVVAALILMSGVASAIGGANKVPQTPIATPTSTTEPVAESESPTPIPSVTAEPIVIDVAYFRSSAERDLTDFGKDLTDMDVTLDEGGYWRLLSNSLELSFNLGQLQSLDAPANIAAQWESGLEILGSHIVLIDDAVKADDDAATRAAIAAARAHVEVLKALASTGQ